MKKDEIPSMRAIKLEEDMAKYKPEVAELTEESIQKFVSDFVEGKLKVSIDKFLLLNAHDSVYVFLISDWRWFLLSFFGDTFYIRKEKRFHLFLEKHAAFLSYSLN